MNLAKYEKIRDLVDEIDRANNALEKLEGHYIFCDVDRNEYIYLSFVPGLREVVENHIKAYKGQLLKELEAL